MFNSPLSLSSEGEWMQIIQWILSLHLPVRLYAKTKKGNRLYAALQYSASYVYQSSTVLVTLKIWYLFTLTHL